MLKEGARRLSPLDQTLFDLIRRPPNEPLPRASSPHTPEIDLAARRAFAADGGVAPVVTPDIAAFCQSGISVIIAACRQGEAPVAGVGCGCRILPDGRVRLLLLRPANGRLLALVERGGSVAATFSRPTDHRSIQVKGSRAVIAPADDDDRRAAVAQSDGLRQELIDVDYSPAFASAYCHVEVSDIVAVDLRPDAAFAQTPGPGAGAELKP